MWGTVSPGLLGLLPIVMRTCSQLKPDARCLLLWCGVLAWDVSKGIENMGTGWKQGSRNYKYLTDGYWSLKSCNLKRWKKTAWNETEMKQQIRKKTQDHNRWAKQGTCCSLGKYYLQVSQHPRGQRSRTKNSLKTAIFYTRWKSWIWTWRRGKEGILFSVSVLGWRALEPDHCHDWDSQGL